MLGEPVVGADGTIYAVSCDGKLYALNPDGTQRWVYMHNGGVLSVPLVTPDGRVYLTSTIYAADATQNFLHALNADGTPCFTLDLGGDWSFFIGCWVAGLVLAADGTVYCTNSDGRIFAVNPDSTVNWTFDAGRNAAYHSSALGFDGTIYLPGSVLFALNPDGSVKWSYDSATAILGAPVVAGDGTVYFAGRYKRPEDFNPESSLLTALNPDGSLKWAYDSPQDWLIPPTIGQDGTLYCMDLRGSNPLYAFSPDGTLLWHKTYAPETIDWFVGPAISVSIDAAGTLYLCCGFDLLALNPDGSEIWKYDSQSLLFGRPAIGKHGALYLGGGALFAFGGA